MVSRISIIIQKNAFLLRSIYDSHISGYLVFDLSKNFIIRNANTNAIYGAQQQSISFFTYDDLSIYASGEVSIEFLNLNLPNLGTFS